MTSSRILKFFAALFVLSTAAAIWLWYSTGEPPESWLVRVAAVSFVAALPAGLVDVETRPRVMLRFLAALFALLALIAFAADISRPAGEGFAATSLMQHLRTLAPSLIAAIEKSVNQSLDPYVWDPLLTSLLGLPAALIFLLLAIAAGYAGRPRRRVRIFINDL